MEIYMVNFNELPIELLRHIYSFDDNIVNKKIRNDCIKEINARKGIHHIINYLSQLHIFYKIYCDNYFKKKNSINSDPFYFLLGGHMSMCKYIHRGKINNETPDKLLKNYDIKFSSFMNKHLNKNEIKYV